MKAWAAVVIVLGGCDGLMPEPMETAAIERDEPTLVAEPSWRYGTVIWSEVDSDCPDTAWNVDEVGMAIIEGDEVTLVFETMPPLSGTLLSRRATVAGEVTFMGETGADVTCKVDGDTAVAPDGESMEGSMHERLSSVGDVNCDTRGRYRLVLDPL